MFSLVTRSQNKGLLRERVADMAKRCGDLTPLAEPVRQRLIEGNREAILQGVSPDGNRVAPLKRSTIKRREGRSGPPRAPGFSNSRVITMYEVKVIAGPQKLTFTGGWPDFEPILGWLDKGTRKMVARPTMGFRQADLDWVRGEMKAYVTGDGYAPGWRGFMGRLFG